MVTVKSGQLTGRSGQRPPLIFSQKCQTGKLRTLEAICPNAACAATLRHRIAETFGRGDYTVDVATGAAHCFHCGAHVADLDEA